MAIGLGGGISHPGPGGLDWHPGGIMDLFNRTGQLMPLGDNWPQPFGGGFGGLGNGGAGGGSVPFSQGVSDFDLSFLLGDGDGGTLANTLMALQLLGGRGGGQQDIGSLFSGISIGEF